MSHSSTHGHWWHRHCRACWLLCGAYQAVLWCWLLGLHMCVDMQGVCVCVLADNLTAPVPIGRRSIVVSDGPDSVPLQCRRRARHELVCSAGVVCSAAAVAAAAGLHIASGLVKRWTSCGLCVRLVTTAVVQDAGWCASTHTQGHSTSLGGLGAAKHVVHAGGSRCASVHRPIGEKCSSGQDSNCAQGRTDQRHRAHTCACCLCVPRLCLSSLKHLLSNSVCVRVRMGCWEQHTLTHQQCQQRARAQ